ncbi:MAG: hypothetical protein GXX96_10715 [Planctomycetaceae bacterium]|jgi:hypothetical protein|nr:hypothetical protein [Planctomycetaceae bacterium]
MNRPQLHRRAFLTTAAAGTVFAAASPRGLSAESGRAPFPCLPADGTVRDRLWIWGGAPGATNDEWGHAPSRMTATEAAFYMGIPNLFLIRHKGRPALEEYDQYALALSPLKRVVWALVESGGDTDPERRDFVLKMPARFPNIAGFIMDDYFKKDGSAHLTIDQLQELEGKRRTPDGRKLPLYVVVYTHQLDLPIQPHLKHCDKITFWTWKSEDLANLETNFEKLEKIAPNHPKLLGCYLWDFGNKKPMPLDLMKRQTEYGYRLLQAGRIEGMIFLEHGVCDIGLDTVLWTKEWIAKVGEQRLADQ